MIADIKFLNVPEFSIISRRYPIGDLTKVRKINNLDYNPVKHTISGASVPEDLDFELKVPKFDNYSTINIVKIGTRYYTVVSVRENTRANSSIIFELRYNPVSSLLSSVTGLTGWFERTPNKVFPAGRINIPGTMKQSGFYPFKNMECSDSGEFFVVQISSKKSLKSSSNSVLTKYITYVHSYDGTERGFLVAFSGKDANNETVTGTWGSIAEAIHNPDESFGIPSDSIFDISVSRRSPWETVINGSEVNVKVGTKQGLPNTTFTALDGRRINETEMIGLLNINKSPVAELIIELTDYQRYCGTITIVDETQNEIFTIPNDYLDADNKAVIPWYAFSDYGGLYTLVNINDKFITIPEGKLPWIGDAWKDYVIRSRDSDRQAMNHAIDMSRKQMEMDLVSGASNAMLTGTLGAIQNPVGSVAGLAQFGMSAVSSAQQQQLSEWDAKKQQSISENRIRNSPSSNYQTAYGLTYLHNAIFGQGAGVKIETPSNFTEEQFNQYVAYNGWPCNAMASIVVSSGYIKGLVYNMEGNGMMGDRLRQEIMAGCHLVMI